MTEQEGGPIPPNEHDARPTDAFTAAFDEVLARAIAKGYAAGFAAGVKAERARSNSKKSARRADPLKKKTTRDGRRGHPANLDPMMLDLYARAIAQRPDGVNREEAVDTFRAELAAELDKFRETIDPKAELPTLWKLTADKIVNSVDNARRTAKLPTDPDTP